MTSLRPGPAFRPVRLHPLRGPFSPRLPSSVRALGQRWGIILILAAHLVLGVVYSIVNPIFEAYDEWGHYPYLRYIANEKRLPPAGQRLARDNDEAHQPPLYYVVAGLVTSLVSTGPEAEPDRNPLGSPLSGGVGGYNRVVHTEAEDWPYAGTALAFHLARWVSVLAATVTVWMTYKAAQEVFREREGMALAASVMVAFLPSFLFVGSMVNNDMMAVMFCTVAIWLSFRMLRIGLRWLEVLGLVASVSLAMLSKLSAVLLLPFFLFVTAVLFYRAVTAWKGRSTGWCPMAFVLVLMGLVLAERVAHRMPRVAGYERTLAAIIAGNRPLHWQAAWSGLNECFKTLVVRFGWGSVYPDPWLYTVFAFVGALALVGVLVCLARRSVSLMGWAAVAAGSALAVLIGQVLVTGEGLLLQGRYFMVAIAPLGILVVSGMRSVFPLPFGSLSVAACCVGMIVLGSASPYLYIRPAYASPPLEGFDENIAPAARAIGARFGEGIELLAAEVSTEQVDPGGSLMVRVTWRSHLQPMRNHALAIKVLGSDGAEWGKVLSYPGNGMRATSTWRPNDRFTDVYTLNVSEAALGQRAASVQVCMFELTTEGLIYSEAVLPDGRLTTSVELAKIKIAGEAPTIPPDAEIQSVEFGGQLGLLADLVSLDGASRIQTTLYWQRRAEVAEDLVVFVHLLDSSGRLVAQCDEPPLGGAYPPYLWSVGEIVQDTHQLDIPFGLPSGDYRLVMGLYPAATVERLAAVDANSGALPDNVVELAQIRLR